MNGSKFLRSYLIHRWWAIKRCFLQLVSSYLVSPASWERNYQLEQHSRQIIQTTILIFQSNKTLEHWNVLTWPLSRLIGTGSCFIFDPLVVWKMTCSVRIKAQRLTCIWNISGLCDYLLGISFSNWADIVTMLGSWMLHLVRYTQHPTNIQCIVFYSDLVDSMRTEGQILVVWINWIPCSLCGGCCRKFALVLMKCWPG